MPNQRNVFITEHLGPSSIEILKNLKNMQRNNCFTDCWIANNTVFIKIAENNVIRLPANKYAVSDYVRTHFPGYVLAF
ncbi:MAG: hypothetical protein AAGK97_12950 [Bacteroidota bacterium]